MAQEDLSEADINAVADAIRNATLEPLGARDAFCNVWPGAEQALTLLEPIVSVIPGFGLFAKAAIAVVLTAGKGAHSALCPR